MRCWRSFFRSNPTTLRVSPTWNKTSLNDSWMWLSCETTVNDPATYCTSQSWWSYHIIIITKIRPLFDAWSHPFPWRVDGVFSDLSTWRWVELGRFGRLELDQVILLGFKPWPQLFKAWPKLYNEWFLDVFCLNLKLLQRSKPIGILKRDWH